LKRKIQKIFSPKQPRKNVFPGPTEHAPPALASAELHCLMKKKKHAYK